MRRGFSLTELVVSITVGGMAAALMGMTLVRQQQFYSSASAILETRSHTRDAADVLATDIRSGAVSLGVPAMSDTAIEIFTTIASSIACTVLSPNLIGLPPLTLASGSSLTSMLVQPDTGDLALIYTAPPSAPDSGGWETIGITGFSLRSVSTGCPAATGFTSAADATTGQSAYSVALATVTTDPISVGTPVHFVRRVRYSIYRSSDNNWYLGYRRCKATGSSVCVPIQPIAGPYDHPGDGKSGIAFRYFDRNGNRLHEQSDASSLARVEFVVRATSAGRAALSGQRGSPYRDSIVVSVAPRNRIL